MQAEICWSCLLRDAWTGWHIIQLELTAVRIMQAHAQDSSLTVAKLGLAQIDLLKGETTNAITLLEGTLQEVTGWLDALKVLHSSVMSQGHFLVDCNESAHSKLASSTSCMHVTAFAASHRLISFGD